MLQSYVTPAFLVVVALVHAACLGVFLVLMSTRPHGFPGWRTVQPGGTHWFCFLGSWAFATLISWVWLFVGSARSDHQSQMNYAFLLILAFGIAAFITGVYMVRLRRMALRWRGVSIRWRSRGRDIHQKMDDFVSWRHPLSGLFHLKFKDGTILKLDLYASNAEEFAVKLSNRVGGKFDYI